MNTIPIAVHDAIERGSCIPLPDHSGWNVPTEPTRAPCCGTMKALFVVRQKIDASASEWVVKCWECENKMIMDLARSTSQMFQKTLL